MLRNQLRADFYKLRHSRLFWITAFLVLIIFIALCVMSFGSDGFYMGFAREFIGVEPVLDGFVAFAFEDRANPSMWEVIYSATGFTFILWLVLLVLTVQFFTKEFTTGTVKLSIAFGTNKSILFFSKLIVILTYYGILFYAYNILAFIYCCFKTGLPLTATGMVYLLKLTTLFFMILVVFTMFCMVMCIIFPNPVLVITCMIAFMYSYIFMILGTYGKELSTTVKLYFSCNPMNYLWTASGFWAYPEITYNIFRFFIVGSVVLSISACLIQERKEVK